MLNVAKISGADAASFLQGQLTSDVLKLDNNWQYTGYCSPKGRLLLSGILYKVADDFFLIFAADLEDVVGKRLKMFVMRSKVDIQIYPAKMVVHDAMVDPSLPADANPDHGVLQVDQTHILSMGDKRLHLEPLTEAQPIHAQNLQHLQALFVTRGFAMITAPTSEAFVPQMINLDLIGGVSFKKGCYTGQEIVARMHYLGKPKQRLFLLGPTSESTVDFKTVSVGTKLHSVSLESQSNAAGSDPVSNSDAGTIVSVDHASQTMLAVVRISELANLLFPSELPDLHLQLREMPYPVIT